jgi:hypothetical protein
LAHSPSTNMSLADGRWLQTALAWHTRLAVPS